MGVYEPGQQFPGTDRLSMGVQPHMERVLRSNRQAPILWEGDRLSNRKLLRLATELGHDLLIVEVTAPADLLAARRAAERNQPDEFIRRCRTKVANIKREFPVEVRSMASVGDATALADWLLDHRI